MKLKKLVKHISKNAAISSLDAQFNLDAEYYVEVLMDDGSIKNGPLESKSIDAGSVMLYEAYNRKYYKSGRKTPCRPLNPIGFATSLSSGDKEYFLSQYEAP